MWKQDLKRNLAIFMKAGLPFTLLGMTIVFVGIYLLKNWFRNSDYLGTLLIVWLALFWFIYQPLFLRKINKIKAQIAST